MGFLRKISGWPLLMSTTTIVNNDSYFTCSPDAKKRPVIILITGPYARKWFLHLQCGIEHDQDEKMRWVLAPDADDIKNQLKRLGLPRSEIAVLAFFPFLPDGQASSELTLKLIADWQAAFNACPLSESLQCIFGIYAQLSQQRFVNDPERAIWLGTFDINATKKIEIDQEITRLNAMPEQHSQWYGYYALQRFAMVDAMQLWMRNTNVMRSLQSLFNKTPLKLTGVMISDYSEGFTQHGAWANWIANRFKIYPGLASKMSLPQRPDVLCQREITTFYATVEKPRYRRKWPKIFIVVTALLSAFFLTTTTIWQARHLIEVRNNLEKFVQIESSQIQDKQNAFNTLLRYHDERYGCVAEKILRLLRLSQCDKIMADLEKFIGDYQSSLFSLAGSVNLFSSGSTEFDKDSDQYLRKLVTIIINNPEVDFMIVGHSDNTGTHKINMHLSEKRALVVRDWLLKNTTMPISKFKIKGVGDTDPIANNETEEGRRKNRRVDLIPIPLNQHINNE